jgi:fatty acid desaturase
MIARFYRHADGAWPNTLVIAYTLAGYVGGIVLLTAAHWLANLAGLALVAHTLVTSAYLLHEFAHQTIFKSAEANNRWGVLMTWITGSCYAPFASLRHKHMRHHIDRADVLTFDCKRFLMESPVWFRKLVLAAEWAWIPAVEFIMHAYVMVLPFVKQSRKASRPRILLVGTVRFAAFAFLGWISLKALLLYGVAWMIMLQVLRFSDAYQHTYDAFAVLEEGSIPDDKVRDRAYEQANTYSNLVSVAHPVWNLLLLNFSYHNAHHERPVAPWYQLPALHRQLYGDHYGQVIPMRDLLKGYHRDRVTRVLADDYGSTEGPNKAHGFIGAVGVSFLTAV